MAEERDGASKPVAIGCIVIFTSPFWLMGVNTIIDVLRQKPSDSIVDTLLPTLTGFALIILGVLPIVLVIVGFKFEPRRKPFYKEIRAIPAQWKPEWSSERLVDQTIATGSVINAMTIFLAIVSLAFGFFAFVAVRSGAWIGLLLLIVPLILVGFVVAKIRGGMRRKRFGKSELALDEMPAHVGETLRGSIVIEKLRPEELQAVRFEIRLTSLRRRTWTESERGHGRQRSETSVLWQGTSTAPGSATVLKEDGLCLPVAIEIPSDQQATNDALERDVIYWQLEASGPMPGIDYYSRFEVPVFVR